MSRYLCCAMTWAWLGGSVICAGGCRGIEPRDHRLSQSPSKAAEATVDRRAGRVVLANFDDNDAVTDAAPGQAPSSLDPLSRTTIANVEIEASAAVAGHSADTIPPQPSPSQGVETSNLPESGSGHVTSLSLADLNQIAMSHNPTLHQAFALVQQAEGNWLQVGLYPNPVIGYDGNGNNGLFDAQGAYVSQTIVTANKLKLNREVASHDVQRAQWESQAQNLRVINEIQIRYTAALGAQRQVATAEELLKISEEGVRISEKLLEGEQVSRPDVLQARLQLNKTMIQLRDARYRESAAWKQLANVVGWPDLPVAPLEGRLEEQLPEIDAESAWQTLLASNPVLHAARMRAAAANTQIRREAAQPYPDVKVTAGVWRDRISPPTMMLGINAGVAIPIFDRNQGNIAAAEAEFRAAECEVNRLELVMRDRMAEVFQRYQSASFEERSYRDTILPTAEENLALTLKSYEAGELDFIRVLTARRDLFDARVNYVTALTSLRIAVIEIEGMLLTGGLDPVISNPTSANAAGQTTGPGN